MSEFIVENTTALVYGWQCITYYNYVDGWFAGADVNATVTVATVSRRQHSITMDVWSVSVNTILPVPTVESVYRSTTICRGTELLQTTHTNASVSPLPSMLVDMGMYQPGI